MAAGVCGYPPSILAVPARRMLGNPDIEEITEMAKQADRLPRQGIEAESGASRPRMFAAMVEVEARAYVRDRDLPGLIALWPQELADQSQKGSLLILSKLRRALRGERRRAYAGHWSYDLNRHLGLMSAYRGELARLNRTVRAGVAQPTPEAGKPRNAVTRGRLPSAPSR
jgi:hypothetical protein